MAGEGGSTMGKGGGGRGSTMEQACFLLNRHFFITQLAQGLRER